MPSNQSLQAHILFCTWAFVIVMLFCTWAFVIVIWFCTWAFVMLTVTVWLWLLWGRAWP